MAVELATAYVSLVPSMKGVQGNIAKALGGSPVTATLDRAGRSWGDRLSSAIGTGLKVGAGAIAGVAAAVGGLAMVGGISRALNIEDAQAKLKGLGHDTRNIETIMGSALGAVRGTAFGLDEAATAAAGAVAAGIEPGKELERYLKLTGDAATIAGVSLGEMGPIFNRVQTQGRAYTMELNMLADRGIPIFQWLADEYGVTAVEFRKMVSEGKVDAETFRSVIEENIGGAALESGNTTRGAFRNTLAALSRFGEAVANTVLPHLRGAFGEAIVVIDGLTEKVKPGLERFGQWFETSVAPMIEGSGQRILDTLDRIGSGDGIDLSGLLDRFSGLAGPLSDVVSLFSPLGLVLKGMQPVLPQIGDSLGRIGAAVGGALAEALPIIAPAFAELATSIAGAIASVLPTLVPVVEDLAVAFAQMVPKLLPIVPAVVDLAGAALRLVSPLLESEATIWALVTAFAAWKAAQGAMALGAIIASVWRSVAAFAASTAAKAADLAQTAALRAMYAGDFLRSLGQSVVQLGRQAAAWAASTAAAVANRGATMASVAAMGIVRGATVAWTVAQRALNLAMSMNPIGLVVTALVLLGAALVTAYQKSETFRNIVQGAWNGIKAAASAVWNWLKGTFEAMKAGLAAVGRWFQDRGRDIDFVWQLIRSAAATAWNFISNTVFLPMRAGIALVKLAFDLARNGVRVAWDAVKSILRTGWQWIDTNVFSPVKAGIALVKVGFETAKSGITTAWDAVKAALKAGWDWINDKVFDPFGRGIDRVVGWVRSGRDNIKSAWEAVKAGFASPINWVIENAWNKGIRKVFNSVADAIRLPSNLRLPEIAQIAVGSGRGGGGGVPVVPREKGGPVRKGMPYIVGEKRPELFVPDENGFIVPRVPTQNPLLGRVSGSNPPHGGLGDWIGDRWENVKSAGRWVGDKVRDAAGNVLEWVRGGLAKAAEVVLNPVKSLIGSTVGSTGGKLGELIAGTSTSAIDHLLDWIRGKDEEGAPDAGGRQLRGARPHVNNAAYALADMVGGIRTMQAFNQSMAGGHPRGLAVDFIDSVGKLNRLADVIVSTGGFDRFSYMAWQGRLWSPGRGWRPQGRGYGNDPFHRWHLHGEWFDSGGTLLPGWNVVHNGTRKREHLANVTDAVNRGGGGGGNTYDFSGAHLGYSKEELVRELDRRDRKALVRHNLQGVLG